MVNPQTYLDYSTHLSYLLIFILPALGGHLIPIPEEVILLLAGYLAGEAINNVYLTILVAILGVLVGDNILFWLSRRGSHIIDRLKQKLSPVIVQRFEYHLKNHLRKTIFLGRFVIGLRFLSPVLSGSHGVPWKTFQLYNLLGSLIYVPLLVFLGYHFHDDAAPLITKIVFARHVIVIVLASVLTILITRWVKRKLSAILKAS